MKNLISILIILAMVFCISSSIAEQNDTSILFRGVEWGSTFEEFKTGLPEGVKMSDLRTNEYWNTMESNMFTGNGHSTKGDLGAYAYAFSNTLDEVKVAGYAISDLYAYFIYRTDDNGLLVRDDAHTALIYAYYEIEPKDPDAVYSDLLEKLSSVYGNITETNKEDKSTYSEQNIWRGADGTMVSAVRIDYSSGNHVIFIKYGFTGGDDLIAAAYEAAILEETKNAGSSTEGL